MAHHPHLRPDVGEYHRHTLSVRALPRHRARHAGPHRGPDRHPDVRPWPCGAAGAQRQRQDLAVADSKRLSFAPEIATVEEGGFRLPRRAVARDLAAEKHAKPIIEKLQRRRGRRLGRPGRASQAHRARPGDLSARPADARRACGSAKGRDREMVSDHQGGRHQAGAVFTGATPA